jgi:gamma-glutamylcyclotransferase (GGCT)/AIG2-like uncharacterized protein YtfP
MTRDVLYFAYGTLQKGLPNYGDLAAVVGEPVGRFKTEAPHALVVPLVPGCANPGCNLLHRMAALVPDAAMYVEGDLFLLDSDGLRAVDRLESYVEGGDGPYVRRKTAVVPLQGGGPRRFAQAFHVADPVRWRELVSTGRAEAIPRYTAELAGATLKACCARDPGHAGDHDVVDVFAEPS